MNRKVLLFLGLEILIVASDATAQRLTVESDVGRALVDNALSADDAWTGITRLSKPSDDKKSDLELRPSTLRQAERLVQASQGARAFYERFPLDPRNTEAKKLEAVFALRGVQAGAEFYKAAAFTTGAAYRANRQNAGPNRFQVALQMDSMNLAVELKGKRFIDDGVRYERLADTLQAEFGDTSDVYELYVNIIRTTDITTSTRVASKLLAKRGAPAWVQQQAQTVLDRSRLIGNRLDLKLNTVGGSVVDLGKPSSGATVIYYWHASAAEREFAILDRYKRAIGGDVRWVTVGLGANGPVSDKPLTNAPFASWQCYESAQPGNPAVGVLRVPQTPYAYVIDAAGRVVGYGPPERVAGFLKKDTR